MLFDGQSQVKEKDMFSRYYINKDEIESRIKKLKIGQKEISFVQLVEILEVYFWKMLQGLPKVSKIKKRSSDYQAYIGS